MRNIVLFSLLMSVSCILKGQCTVVNEDGSVNIVFSQDNNDEISRYNVLTGDFETIGTLNNGTFTDVAVNANEQSYTYHIGGTTDKSVSTIYIATQENSSENKIIINTNTADLSYNTDYALYRKTPSDADFVFLYNIESPVVEDEGNFVCGAEYRIIALCGDCYSYSNIAEVSKNDNTEPATPELLPVTIDLESQKLIVSWNISQSTDTWGYVICKTDEEGKKQAIDTVYGRMTDNYTCDMCDVTDTNYITVFAFDSCINTSPLTETYNNIVLKYTRTSCDEPIHLYWNQSEGAYDVLLFYINMIRSDGTKTYQCDNLQFDIPTTDIIGDIKIYLSDIFGNCISNMLQIATDGGDTLNYAYIESVSVGKDNLSVTVTAAVDASKQVRGYQLWRSMDNGEFTKVQDLDYSASGFIQTEDKLDFPADEHIYTYYLAAPDVCGGIYTYSNKFSSVQLKIDASESDKIKLFWNAANPFNWAVEGYEIYRFAENEFDNAVYIGSTSFNSFTDNTDNILSKTDRTFYYVKAFGNINNGGQEETKEVISSNGYALFESIFFVPNAFCPKKGNAPRISVFKPECHFIRSGTYTMQIYNKWGEKLFETYDPDEGWNGKYKDAFCPVGTYVYKIAFTDSEGNEQINGGVFMLYD